MAEKEGSGKAGNEEGRYGGEVSCGQTAGAADKCVPDMFRGWVMQSSSTRNMPEPVKQRPLSTVAKSLFACLLLVCADRSSWRPSMPPASTRTSTDVYWSSRILVPSRQLRHRKRRP